MYQGNKTHIKEVMVCKQCALKEEQKKKKKKKKKKKEKKKKNNNKKDAFFKRKISACMRSAQLFPGRVEFHSLKIKALMFLFHCCLNSLIDVL
jgi:hypothetical protein